MAGIGARERIEMRDGALADELRITPDLDEPGRVLGVHDQQADAAVRDQVASCPALECRVAAGAGPVEVHPDETRVRLATRQDRRQDPADGPRQQVLVGRWDRSFLEGSGRWRHHATPSPVASMATTRVGWMRHRTGVSDSPNAAGMQSPK